MPIDFDAYFKALAATAIDAKTEHSDRGALERLLNEAAAQADRRLHVQHEPKRDKGGGGSPDYMVKRDARIVGYVEVKTIDEALSKVLRGDQIKKYQKLSDNLILTDYLEFIWVRKGQDPQRARLAHSDDLSSKKLALKPEAVDQVAKLLGAFFSEAPQNIGRGQTLAIELATRAALLRDFLTEELIRQQKNKDEGKLHGLFQAFRDQIFHDLDIKAFADAFAQMLAYGLFLARLNAGDGVQVTLDNVRKFIPGSFSLIRELVRFLEEMDEPEYRPSRWVVDEILSIVNGIDLASIHNDLSFRARKAISRKVKSGDEDEHRLFEKDPFIYFYEDFLKAYDPAMRKGRGVYYTPPPVVNFIVRAIDDILKDTFGIADGLADHRQVTVLDFACGTGTFLLEVFERIFDTIGGPESGRADGIVREHLTKNIYGFEYLIAPYTIAHLKLSQYLRDKGHALEDKERLQVFLTNTLEPVEPQGNLLMPALAEEVKGAQAVKDKPILVITGNPPYSGHSKNLGAAAQKLVDRYRVVDGLPLAERKSWLQDDYVKFIAFAQDKIEREERGVIALITNHNYLDGPTFRGMRQSLLDNFDGIYILDLHGSTQRIENVPEGVRDENVFDIKTGVAILILVKGGDRTLRHSELWGHRQSKYVRLANLAKSTVDWTPLLPSSPNYFLVPKSGAKDLEGIPIGDMFGVSTTALQTSRDALAVGFSQAGLQRRVSDLRDLNAPDSQFRSLLKKKLGSSLPAGDSEFWTLEQARTELRSRSDITIVPLAYRPFDTRYVIYDDAIVHRMKREVSDDMAIDNLALLAPRQLSSVDFRHAFVVNAVSEMCVISSATKEQNRVFPLRKRVEGAWIENLSPAFRDFLDARYGEHYDPEQILGYIYAVLHAPTYRSRYAEFLRIDFPRIPFAETPEQFEALSALGWNLIQTHLLKTVPRSKPRLGDYTGKGDHTVEAVVYCPDEATIWINPKRTQGFANVPQAVWDFHIGGYQVIDKYLKSRKGRTLNLDEQTHVGNIAESLNFTIAQMAKIDVAYLAAFPEAGG